MAVLDLKKIKILLDYKFTVAFLRGKIGWKVFLDNIKAFEKALLEKGFDDWEIKWLLKSNSNAFYWAIYYNEIYSKHESLKDKVRGLTYTYKFEKPKKYQISISKIESFIKKFKEKLDFMKANYHFLGDKFNEYSEYSNIIETLEEEKNILKDNLRSAERFFEILKEKPKLIRKIRINENEITFVCLVEKNLLYSINSIKRKQNKKKKYWINILNKNNVADIKETLSLMLRGECDKVMRIFPSYKLNPKLDIFELLEEDYLTIIKTLFDFACMDIVKCLKDQPKFIMSKSLIVNIFFYTELFGSLNAGIDPTKSTEDYCHLLVDLHAPIYHYLINFYYNNQIRIRSIKNLFFTDSLLPSKIVPLTYEHQQKIRKFMSQDFESFFRHEFEHFYTQKMVKQRHKDVFIKSIIKNFNEQQDQLISELNMLQIESVARLNENRVEKFLIIHMPKIIEFRERINNLNYENDKLLLEANVLLKSKDKIMEETKLTKHSISEHTFSRLKSSVEKKDFEDIKREIEYIKNNLMWAKQTKQFENIFYPTDIKVDIRKELLIIPYDIAEMLINFYILNEYRKTNKDYFSRLKIRLSGINKDVSMSNQMFSNPIVSKHISKRQSIIIQKAPFSFTQRYIDVVKNMSLKEFLKNCENAMKELGLTQDFFFGWKELFEKGIRNYRKSKKEKFGRIKKLIGLLALMRSSVRERKEIYRLLKKK